MNLKLILWFFFSCSVLPAQAPYPVTCVHQETWQWKLATQHLISFFYALKASSDYISTIPKMHFKTQNNFHDKTWMPWHLEVGSWQPHLEKFPMIFFWAFVTVIDKVTYTLVTLESSMRQDIQSYMSPQTTQMAFYDTPVVNGNMLMIRLYRHRDWKNKT